jgi:hypothetical protein
MKDLTVTAKVPEKKDDSGKVVQKAIEGSAIVKFPESLKEAKEAFGEEACLSNMESSWRVTLQGTIRSRLRKGIPADQIAKDLATAKMGVAATGAKVDPQAAFIAKFKMATPEEQAKMIAELKTAASA